MTENQHKALLAAGNIAHVAGRIVGEDILKGRTFPCTAECLPHFLIDLKEAVIEYNKCVMELTK